MNFIDQSLNTIKEEIYYSKVLENQEYVYKIGEDIKYKSIKKVHPGEEVTIYCLSAFNKYIFNATDFETCLLDVKHHPVSGPYKIITEKKYNAILVKIVDIDIFHDIVWCLTKSAGLLCESMNHINNTAEGRNFLRIKKKEIVSAPVIGYIGTNADDFCLSTGRASSNGGNMDFDFITKGVDLLIPLKSKDPMLFFGDLHAKQGAGELSGVAYECSGAIKLKIFPISLENKINEPLVIKMNHDKTFDLFFIGCRETYKEALNASVSGFLNWYEVLGYKNTIEAYKEIGINGNLIIGQSLAKTVSVAIKINCCTKEFNFIL